MKKIVTLFAVFALDFILLEYASAQPDMKIISPDLYPFLVLFLTLAMTLFLFYEHHFQKAHQQWHMFYQDKADKWFDNIEAKRTPVRIPEKQSRAKRMSKANLLKSRLKKKAPSLDIQYEFIELVRNQIIDMRSSGLSDGEIINRLKQESWDPQVIFIALGRVKKKS